MTGREPAAPTTLGGWSAQGGAATTARLVAARDAALASVGSHGVFIDVLDQDRLETLGGSAGELAGVPFAVKDNIDVAGTRTTAGSALLRDSVPDVDASVVAALREAGAVVVGKTNMHELAFGITSNNAAFGAVRNPVDPTRVAGGSSGGSAAAVALGIVPFSLGTDTGGSVVIPAAFCGVVGFRPTTGRYPGDGLVNLSWTRDTVGLHAGSVADVRLVDRVISRQPSAAEPRLAGVRLGVLRSRLEDVEPAVAEATAAALKALASQGVELVDVEIADDQAIGGGPGLGMVLYEAARLLLARATTVPGGSRFATFGDLVPELTSPDVRGLAQHMADQPVPAEAYEDARRARLRLRRTYAEAFERSRARALVAPSVPVLAPPVGADEVIELHGREVPTFATVTRHTAPGTVAGVPMLSLPLRRPHGALPVGLTLEGAFGEDAALLALGAVLESALAP
ncbi:amidase family protein [Nocardioides sp. 503]|uniref:amidase family protein n=1 Tax=Nocardioides sp. 503 TaxID=2508326 RepID=UPI00106F2A15|nr:amidase family protein [Nocardioides sp. 503]